MSSVGASILAVAYLLPPFYLLWSLRYGAAAGDNPWDAAGLEWETSSPPPAHNFEETPIAPEIPYDYHPAGSAPAPVALKSSRPGSEPR